MSQPLSWADQAISLPPFLTGNLSESQISQCRHVWNTPRDPGAHTAPRWKDTEQGENSAMQRENFDSALSSVQRKRNEAISGLVNQSEISTDESVKLPVPSPKHNRQERRKKERRWKKRGPWALSPECVPCDMYVIINNKRNIFTWLIESPSEWRPESSATTRQPPGSWCVSPVCSAYTRAHSSAYTLLQDADTLWAGQTACVRNRGRGKTEVGDDVTISSGWRFRPLFPRRRMESSFTAAADTVRDNVSEPINVGAYFRR